MNNHQQQRLDSLEGIAYLTDADGVIMAVGRPRWNAFARDNGGEALIDGGGVIGHSVFDAVAGNSVRAGYERLFLAILQRRCRSARLLSRCDSPGVRRQLVITMTPVFVRGAIRRMLFQSVAVAELVRPPMDVFDFRAMGERARLDPALPILGMCSTCQSVRFPAGSSDATDAWIAAEEYYRRGGDSRVRISHRLCPRCENETHSALAA